MKILVTGGRGMVGRNVLEHTIAQKHEILAPARAELDLTDRSAVSAYLREHKPDAVIHAAGKVAGITGNMADPHRFMVENAYIGLHVLEAAREAGVTKLINLGSSCIYPREAVNPISEDAILTGELEPTNEGYAIAKILTLRLAQYISKQYPELHYKTVIPCNLYGRYDSFAPQKSHMLPAAIAKVHAAVAQGHAPVEIWGDGTARREFMYAADLADCIFFCLERITELPDVVNAGMGFDLSINEYYEAVGAVLGFKGEFVHDLTKPVGMQQKLTDVSKLTALGWQPRTTLEAGLKATYAYFLEQLKQ